jgi:hypothetical protein
MNEKASPGRPSAFSRNPEELVREAADASRTWGEESRLLRDEAMGAELLLTRELVEQWGILFEAAEGLNDLLVRQAGHFIEDHLATVRATMAQPGPHNCSDILVAHWRRRIEHLTEGGQACAALLQTESRKFGNALFGLWRPFATVLSRDWDERRIRTHPP